MSEIKKRRGLSYSSFTEYSACPRKWFYRKVLNVPIDSDATEDTEAFTIGKIFHKCLEDTKHNLSGFSFNDCAKVCSSFGIEDVDTVCMIFAMLAKYKEVHAKTSLQVLACEVVIDLPKFYGVIDAVLHDTTKDQWWISDIKTSGSWSDNTVNTAASHIQINIYSKYFKEIAMAVGLTNSTFAGCRLRVTTKSRASRKANEENVSYINRMKSGIRSADIVIPADILKVERITPAHELANEITSEAKQTDIHKFPQNFSNCFSYFKPCNYWSQCNGCNYTEMPKVEVIEA